MRKIYAFCLVAVMALLTSFSAYAEDMVSATITWDIPGSVVIYVGSTGDGNRVSLAPDATSYTAIIPDQTWGTTYVRAAEGYALENAVCQDDGKTITVGGYTIPQISINMGAYAHGGHTVKVNCSKIEYDGNISINFVSGGKVTATLSGTNRAFDLQGGEQTIPFSTKFEKTITFYAQADGSSDPYIKQNENTIVWSKRNQYATTLSHNEITLADGDKFEVKYNDEPAVTPVEKEYRTVNITYGSEEAKAAVTMIRNATKKESLAFKALESFEVEKGDVVRITFNTLDYEVTVNGSKLTPDDSRESTAWESAPINDNLNLTVDAVERQYPTIYLTAYIANPESVLLRDGTLDGPEIDFSKWEAGQTVSQSYTIKIDNYSEYVSAQSFTAYTIPVNGKYGKFHIEAQDGSYIKYSFYKDDNYYVPVDAVSKPDPTNPISQVYIDARKKNENKKLVIKLDNSGIDASDVKFVDRWNNYYDLQKGYNELTIDPNYVKPLSVRLHNFSGEITSTNFVVATNYVKDGFDTETSSYKNIGIKDEDNVMHIFAGKNSPATRALNIQKVAGSEADVTIDRIPRSGESIEYTVFNKSEYTITPADASTPVFVNGAQVELTNGTYTGSVTADTNVFIGDPSVMTITPAEGETIETFEYFLVSFPYATTAEQVLTDDELMFQLGQGWANWGWTIEEVSAAQGKAFKLIPNMIPSTNGTYRFYMPAGFFKVNGSFESAETNYYFTINKTISADDIELLFSPSTTVINEGNGLNVTICAGKDGELDETLVFDTNFQDGTELKVTLGDQELEVFGGWEFEIEGPFFMITVYKDAVPENFEGELKVWVKAGALILSGGECPEINHTWNVVLPKEYTMDVQNPVAEPGEEGISFTVTFPEAKTAEIYLPYGASLSDDDYFAAPEKSRASRARYFETGVIEAVEGAAVPTFKISFANAPASDGHTYTLNLREGTFTLDGYQDSAEQNHHFVYHTDGGLVSGIHDAIIGADEKANVFDINGRIILRNADRDALRSLNRGIYIINGKKVMK